MRKPVYLRPSWAASFLSAALLPAAITVSLPQHVPAASGEDCSNEQQIFVQDQYLTQYDPSYGTQGQIYIRDRQLDTNCQARSSWSMINISDDYKSQAEIGYKEVVLTSGGPTEFLPLTCWQIPSGESCNYVGGVTFTPGTWVEFKVDNEPVGSSNFETWYNLLDGHGWHDAGGGYEDFTIGVSQGETSRIGSYTGMLDHHNQLLYKVGTNSWAGWSHNSLRYETLFVDNYEYRWISISDYEVCEEGGPCPWQ